ncbi:MAG: hypothetical protein KDK33_04135 [Leptospiraceae bacterium]|nr:hypothetical protein [Leptospiraceae bacterium]
MAVDPGMVDMILGTFRNMAAEIKEKKMEGEAVDQMNAVLAQMEGLASEMDDLAAYSTRLANDGLFTKFSEFYGRALASGSSENGESNDDDLMARTLKAYEDSLVELKKNPEHAHIVGVVQRVVDLGKSGLSYPVFLRKAEEEGAFLGLNSPHAGPVIAYDIYCAQKMRTVERLPMLQEIQAKWNELVAKSAFGYANPLEFELARQRIEWEHEPSLIRWSAIETRWERLIEMMVDWVDSFTSFAPYDSRWVDPGGSRAKTMENIQRTQECNPGRLKVREDIFAEYFGLQWDDIFTHETYRAQIESKMLWYSDESVALVRDAYPLCQPGGRPTAEHIKRAEDIHAGQRFKRSDMPTAEELSPMPFAQFLEQHMSA